MKISMITLFLISILNASPIIIEFDTNKHQLFGKITNVSSNIIYYSTYSKRSVQPVLYLEKFEVDRWVPECFICGTGLGFKALAPNESVNFLRELPIGVQEFRISIPSSIKVSGNVKFLGATKSMTFWGKEDMTPKKLEDINTKEIKISKQDDKRVDDLLKDLLLEEL